MELKDLTDTNQINNNVKSIPCGKCSYKCSSETELRVHMEFIRLNAGNEMEQLKPKTYMKTICI